MSYNSTAIIGYSGHSYVVIDALINSGNRPLYYSDKLLNKNNPYNLEYIGFEKDNNFKGWEMNLNFAICIGDNYIREQIAMLINKKLKTVLTVIHPQSIISSNTSFGVGSFISKGAMINPFSSIGNFTILNTGCIIEHECIVDDFSHIAPGAVLCGNVVIGKRTFIGANSVIKQGVKIGDDVIIGAGSVVINDIPNNSMIVGNPGKKI